MSGKRRKFTPEFREQAARLVIETGRPVAHVAAEIGVGDQLLGRWFALMER
jgi:transposase